MYAVALKEAIFLMAVVENTVESLNLVVFKAVFQPHPQLLAPKL